MSSIRTVAVFCMLALVASAQGPVTDPARGGPPGDREAPKAGQGRTIGGSVVAPATAKQGTGTKGSNESTKQGTGTKGSNESTKQGAGKKGTNESAEQGTGKKGSNESAKQGSPSQGTTKKGQSSGNVGVGGNKNGKTTKKTAKNKSGKGAIAGKNIGKDKNSPNDKGKSAGKAKKEEVELPGNTKDASEEDDLPIPDGATEEDIRAVRGEAAMLRVEAKLDKLLRGMKLKGKHDFLPFDKIDSWLYEDGFKGMPASIKKLDKKRVVMAGFMLPIDEVENIKTFYLVKSLWSCCYGTPPDVNGLVHVEIKAKKGVPYHYDPIFVIGTFRLKKLMDEDYVVSIYTLEADSVRVLDLDGK